MADVSELRRRFREAGNDQRSRSGFYAHLNRRIAEHDEIPELLTAAPEQQQLPVLLLAAVHSIVLAEPDLELAAWYPTVTNSPRSSDPFPAFARLCHERGDDLRLIVSTRSVQTNEVGRSALLLPALGLIAEEVGEISLIDVGTSAGLNLQLDRFRYHYSPGGSVGPDSDVVLECHTVGEIPVPRRLPLITSRVGIDRTPIDVNDPDDAHWLMACVWPDQADRFHRLRGAIDLARANPTTLTSTDAVDGLAAVVRSGARSGHPVVINSWVLNYLPEERRVAYVDQLDELGRELDLTWVYAESPGLCPGLPFPGELQGRHLTALMTLRWRHGRRSDSHLGIGHPHGYWFHAA